MELSPEQYEQIRALIEDELRAASRAALDGGATVAESDADLAARRQALEALTPELPPEQP